MSATVTNQTKGVTSTTSDHTCSIMEDGPDMCRAPDPPFPPKPHMNRVKTALAVKHTTGKTLFQNGFVVRVNEPMTPSEPGHGDTGLGGGVNSHTIIAEAKITSGSPNLRAESQPPGRTDDPTTQNHENVDGKVLQVVPEELLGDNPQAFLERCSYDTSTIKCDHQKATTKAQIDIFRGDVIIIVAQRKNAKKPGPPVCTSPPHMKWLVTRSGGVTMLGAAVPPRSEELSGDTLELGDDWTVPFGNPLSLSTKLKPRPAPTDKNNTAPTQLTNDAKQGLIDQKNNYAAQNAAARGSSRVESQDTQQAYKQIQQDLKDGRAAAKQNAPIGNQIVNAATQLANLAQFLLAWRAAQNPVRVQIVGTACTGSVTYEARCYPHGSYKFELPLDPIIAVGQWVSRTFRFVSSIARLAQVSVDGKFSIPGDVKVSLTFAWKEEDYEIQREAQLAISGEFFKIALEVAFPLANLLQLIPGIGTAAATAINWASRWIGAEASVGAGFEIKLSANASVTFRWGEKKGWHWDNAAITFPISLTFYLFARLAWGDTVRAEVRALIEAAPALQLKGNPDGLKLLSAAFTVRIGFTGGIKIDTWFYSYEQSFTYYPESWCFTVSEMPLATLIGN